jgi:thiol-disulfide isomerase/thioredoxin
MALVVPVGSLACAAPTFPPSSGHPLLGAPLPEIRRRESLDGHLVDQGALTAGPVLVKFFAEYCEPCKETLPAAERIHEAYPEVTFVGVDEDESSEAARALVSRYGLTFPVVHDTSNVLAASFGVTSMPMTFVADARGVVRWVGAQGQTEDDLRRAVQAAGASTR